MCEHAPACQYMSQGIWCTCMNLRVCGGGGLIDVDAVQTSLFKADVVKVAS